MGCCYKCHMDENMLQTIHDWIVGKDLVGQYQGFLQIIKKYN